MWIRCGVGWRAGAGAAGRSARGEAGCVFRSREDGGGDRGGAEGWDSTIQSGERVRVGRGREVRGEAEADGEDCVSGESGRSGGDASLYFYRAAQTQVWRAAGRGAGAVRAGGERKVSASGRGQRAHWFADYGLCPIFGGDGARG